jgi:mxaK protein
MGLRRNVHRALAAFAAGLLAAALVDGVALLRAQRANHAIAIMTAGAAAATNDESRREVLFARAYVHGMEGETQRALSGYRRLAGAGMDPLGQAALFNSGNLLARLALAERAGGDEAQALTLFELAKQNYRDVLRANPSHWETKYNLERTLRLAPDSEDKDGERLPSPPARERAVTTMRGLTLGLP